MSECLSLQQNKYVKWVKMLVLLASWLIFTYFLMSRNEKVLEARQLSVSEGQIKCETLIYFNHYLLIKLINYLLINP